MHSDWNKLTSWKKDHDLSWSLISAITDNEVIRQVLFPAPGGDTMKSKSRPKADTQYEVAKVIFVEHPAYKDAFAQATAAAEKREWGTKVKNRIQ